MRLARCRAIGERPARPAHPRSAPPQALAAIWEKAYLLPLFGPGLLAAAYLVGQLLGVSLSLPSLPEFTLPGGVEIPFMFGIPKARPPSLTRTWGVRPLCPHLSCATLALPASQLLGFLAGQGMKLTFDIWNFICPLIGLGDARLMYWK